MTKACDIVIPVYNALDAVLDLLHSLSRFTSYPHKVIIIDDCSQPFVGRVLKEWCEPRPQYSYVRNEENFGFLKTVNRALELTTADYVCILNSDTVVTNYWLEGLVSAVEGDPRIAVVNPATNNAPVVAIPLPPGYSIHMMAQRLAELNSSGGSIEVVTGVGFCWFLAKDMIRRFGMFDEVYSPGYCEEADYAMRVRAHGYKIVTAPNSFVFHRGTASFVEKRQALYLRNRKLFDSRWKADFEPADAHYRDNDPLQSFRKTLFPGTIPLLQTVRVAEIKSKLRGGLSLLKQREFRIFVKNARETASEFAQRYKTLTRSAASKGNNTPQDPFNCRNIPRLAGETSYPDATYCTKLPRSESRLRIVFLVWRLSLCGGVTDIVDMVNQLALQGHDPIIVTLDRVCSPTYAKRLLTRPLVFKDLDHLVDFFPEADVVVATFWPTAYLWYPRLAQRHDFIGAYYVQDFEPLFYAEGSEDFERALQTYSLGLNAIAISDWIKGKLAEVGQPATMIPVGVDLGIFYPRRPFVPKGPKDEYVITAMTRPNTPRRGFHTIVKACEILHAQDPRMRFRFFGCDSSAFKGVSFPWESAGIIEDPGKMAEHLSSCDLLVDPSDFQGFGRCGLEAMACGLPTVLTNEGGTWEYGLDGENTLMARARDPHEFAQKVLQIRRDPQLQERLSLVALETAGRFCHRKIGKKQCEYFEDLVRSASKKKHPRESAKPPANIISPISLQSGSTSNAVPSKGLLLSNSSVVDEHFVPENMSLQDAILAKNTTAVHHLIRYKWAVKVLADFRENKLLPPDRTGQHSSRGDAPEGAGYGSSVQNAGVLCDRTHKGDTQSLCILDVACGAGYGTFEIAKAFPDAHVLGVDYDSQAVQTAAKRYSLPNLRFQTGDGVAWADTIGRTIFDYIVSFDTIEHVVHRELFLENVVTHIHPSGALFLSTPCGKDHDVLHPEWQHHRIEYSSRSLYSLLRRYFGVVTRPEDSTFPCRDVFAVLKNTGVRYLLQMNPVICMAPITITDNPYCSFALS